MGVGIGLHSKGKHIAYTAGTGVLVFMDLVAYLLIKVIETYGGVQIFDDDQTSYVPNNVSNNLNDNSLENPTETNSDMHKS
jgi:hypothetical protein